ncbi:MAG: hypothetical protein WBC96_02195, partial [Thermodesulfobacteriota bacterium]
MRRLVSTMELRFIRQIVIPFLVLFFAISSVSAISEEFSPNQKEFSDSLEAYNKVRAQQIVQQARYEEQSQQKKKNIEVAQTLSNDKTETQDERIEQLEKKLNSVTQELQELKSGGVPDDKLQSIEDKLSILAEEIDNIKSASVVSDPTYEQVYGAAPAASKVYLKDKGLSIGGYGELLVGQVKE